MRDDCKVGVVTVTYNSQQVLPDFFASLWSQTHTNFVLYAVDNASSDDSVQLVRAEADERIRLIENASNVGVAAGNNIGITAARNDGCEYVLLLNNDTVFSGSLLANPV